MRRLELRRWHRCQALVDEGMIPQFTATLRCSDDVAVTVHHLPSRRQFRELCVEQRGYLDIFDVGTDVLEMREVE